MKLCIVVVLGLILSTSSAALLSVYAAGYSGRPYLGSPVSLPGVIEAANYDLGGQGVAYNVLSGVNQGGAYRTSEAVSLEQTGDSTTSASGDAYDMGWINPTEWENYTVTSAGGPFTASIRVAANGSGGTFHLECPTGTKITGELTIPNTGGWQTYTTLTAPVTLPAGNQVLRVVWDTAPSGFVGNFHWIQISSSSNVGSVNTGGSSSRPYLGSPVSLPGVVEAANYDLGGQGVAYNVLSSVNQGGAYRTSEAVSLEQTGDSTTSASGDAYDMGWINPTEWENYTVTSVGGPFTASIRVAANGSGGTFHLECPTGTKITGELTIPNTGGWQTYTTLTAPVTLPAGNQVLRIVWDTAPSGFVGNFHWIQISSSSNVGSVNAGGSSSRPYLGSPVSLPGVLEAANYDLGGQGVAYNVLSSVNQGGAYRTSEAVSLEQTGDSTTSASGDAYDMGWINPTEWENYTVTSAGGPFTASIRVAANGSGGTFHLECPTGTKITGELKIPNTGGWQTYTTLTAPVTLPAGNQVLRIVWDTAPSGFVGNFHWIQITNSSNVGSVNAGGYSGRPYLGSPVSLPGVVEAANYDLGGQGVAYNVLSSVNQGGAYRTTEAVSLEQTGDSTTSASGDAYDMGWINPTEWENYTVTSVGGPFTASIRVAANGSGGTFHLECPTGTKITGELTIPNTGGWQTYTTLTAPVTLPAGNQVLRIVWDTAPSGFVGNFHWIQISSSSSSSSGGTDTAWVVSPATDSISGPYPMTIQYHAVGNVTGRDVTGSVTWTSSNPPVVSIGAGGLALIVGPGSAGSTNVTITATK